MYTMGMGCSSFKIPTEKESTGYTKTAETYTKYSVIITSNDFQADRSAIMDRLMKGNILIVEMKELPLDGMAGELDVICKGDPKRIDEIRNELLVTGHVSKVIISR